MADSLTLMYPNDNLAHYDMDYLIGEHMPMMKSRWSPYGLTSWNVTKFNPTPDGTPPIFAFAATLSWDRSEAVPGMPGNVDLNLVMEDMTRFSDKKPIVLSGEAVGRSAE